MRGHEKIIAMRHRGLRPKIVFVNDFSYRGDTDWFENGEHATVSVEGDNPHRADYRFSVGLTVSISADSRERGQALADAFKRHGAAVVAVGSPCGWSDVWRKPQGDTTTSQEVSHG